MWNKHSKLSEVINDNLRASIVMEKYGLDFFSSGNKSIIEACNAKGLNPDKMIDELVAIEKEKSGFIKFDLWDIDFLAEYIINNHHKYIRKALPELENLCSGVLYNFNQKSSNDNNGFTDMAYATENLFNHITVHLEKEEKMIFPYISKITNISKQNEEFEYAPFGKIENPVNVLRKEHTYISDELEAIQDLLNTLLIAYPGDKNLGAFNEKFSELIKDFHIYIHIENNILFPKTIKLEHSLRNS